MALAMGSKVGRGTRPGLGVFDIRGGGRPRRARRGMRGVRRTLSGAGGALGDSGGGSSAGSKGKAVAMPRLRAMSRSSGGNWRAARRKAVAMRYSRDARAGSASGWRETARRRRDRTRFLMVTASALKAPPAVVWNSGGIACQEALVTATQKMASQVARRLRGGRPGCLWVGRM